jgi:hypothetical protein
MPTTKTANNQTRKNAATTPSTATKPPTKASITVQTPPSPSRDTKTPPTSTDDGKKIFHRDTATTPPTETSPTNALTEAEQLMVQALKQLQEIYNASCKTNAKQITIERATFEKIATTFQQAYEQIKTKASTPTPTSTSAPENASILNALQQMKASIANLEAMQATKNETKTEQCPITKTYADTLKTPITAAQLLKYQEQQRAKEKKFRSIILLDISETCEEAQQWFQTQSYENIAANIEKAIKDELNITCPILEISQQKNIVKIHHCMNNEEADEVAERMDWNVITTDLKPHESIYKVVVHGVLKDTIDLTDPRTIETLTEANHCINPDAIADITPLRSNSTTAKHHSIIVSSKYPEDLNSWIERGFSINYEIHRTERYTTRTQLTQCYNCYGYGHYAKSCQAKTCCGKCGETHATKVCKSTTVKCCQCKGLHEAWHYKCPTRMMMRKQLRELKHRLPFKFIERRSALPQGEPKEEDEQEEPRLKL